MIIVYNIKNIIYVIFYSEGEKVDENITQLNEAENVSAEEASESECALENPDGQKDEDLKLTGSKKEKDVKLDKSKKVFPLIVFSYGVILMLLQWAVGLNLIVLIGAIYMIAVSVAVLVGVLVKRKLYLWFLLGYIAVSFGIATYFIFNGADAGWGAFSSGQTGFSSSENAIWQGEGNFGTRLAGNVLLSAPAFLSLLALVLLVLKLKASGKTRMVATSCVSVLLVGVSVLFVFTTNLRSKPKAFDMSKGHDEYLNNVNKNVDSSNPNVLVILMDDLGYGDTSYNARKANITPAFETPNIDRIATEGLDFDNFYSSYSVCSPARFALMTGRYPYRGYADNVIYPTINTLSPFAATRVFNAIELGANVDGMLGDEVTVAETFKAAGYATGCFGKWHLGDYGEYLPTNQGFDYFYGSHHVNDMVPFYHCVESGGEYEIVKGTKDLDQSDATKLIHDETVSWIENRIENDEKFFAYYATPWPHAPVYAGYDFQGSTGAGIYADCITEFDYYLGQLFDVLEQKGVLDDTIIVFTSDNGPALQGSTNELRGGKYSSYNAGQKVPFYMRWGNNSDWQSGEDGKAKTVEGIATLADLYPTLVEACGITGKVNGVDKENYLPSDVDREIDGVSMIPLINDVDGTAYIHGIDNPILHMKREKINAVQYSVSRQDVLESVKGYTKSGNHNVQTGNEADYAEMPFIKNNQVLTWKYIKDYKNDNPEFFDKRRKNWFMCLSDDTGESYQRADVFPDLAAQYAQTLENWNTKLKSNRRGYYTDYYKK